MARKLVKAISRAYLHFPDGEKKHWQLFEPPPTDQCPNSKGFIILIVSADAEALKARSAVLKQAGCFVRCVTSKEEANKILCSIKFDFVILDDTLDRSARLELDHSIHRIPSATRIMVLNNKSLDTGAELSENAREASNIASSNISRLLAESAPNSNSQSSHGHEQDGSVSYGFQMSDKASE